MAAPGGRAPAGTKRFISGVVEGELPVVRGMGAWGYEEGGNRVDVRDVVFAWCRVLWATMDHGAENGAV